MNRTATYPPKFLLPAMGGYRYFFNGQEADNEVLGEGASLSAEFWQYDSRLGRRWNVDPVFKEYESPYACFAGNPMWFADRFGADTIFDDNNVRQDFLKAYNTVVATIEELSQKIAQLNEELKAEGISKLKKNKIEKNILSAENEKKDWEKLFDDFKNIITSKVKFHYTSNPEGLSEWDMGMLWGEKSFVYWEKDIPKGDIYITVRSGNDDFIIHENRHGNQILEKSNNRSELEIEREAYSFQRIYKYEAVEQFINDALKYFHPDVSSRPAIYDLDAAIKDVYKIHD